MAELSMSQKKDWAKLLYTKENLTQAEIAERVGTTRQSVGKWIKDGKWEALKVSISMTKEEQLRNLYSQFSDLNNTILRRPIGERNPMPAEAETQVKLTKAIKNLEIEVGASEMYSVGMRFLGFLREIDLDLTKRIAPIFDNFILTNSKF
jgi:DNA-binding transcriptional regulator LsrR (DeoR family)